MIQGSRNLIQAAQRLHELGLLAQGQASLPDEDQALAMRYLLQRLWFEAAPEIPEDFPVDSRWPVPALVQQSGGSTYYVHGIVHGLTVPARPGPVRRLVASLKKAGLPLYSEEKLAGHYGYSYGLEILDHRVLQGRATKLKELPPPGLGIHLRKALGLALRAAAWGIPLYFLAMDSATFLAWVGLAFVAAFHYLVWTGLLPLYRAIFHILGLLASYQDQEDLAHYFHSRARAVYSRSWDLSALRRVELPMPLKAVEDPATSKRSQAMAHVVLEAAASAALREVHILTGLNHAREVAYYLGEGSKVP